MRKIINGLRVSTAGLMALAVLNGPVQAASKAQTKNAEVVQLLTEALDTVASQYLGPVDSQRLVEGALEGMLGVLDERSGYISPAKWEEMLSDDSYAGIGFEMSRVGGEVVVQRPYPGGPAALAGMLPGDVILTIDEKTVDGLTLTEVGKRLRGEKGSTVLLRLRRADEALDLSVIRAAIVHPGPVSEMKGDYGYLRLDRMADRTTAELSDVIANLWRQNPRMKGLVLDLRDCPGGLLSTSAEIADVFLDGGVIFSQSGRDPRDSERYHARRGDALNGIPLVVLVNKETAAGAEIVAAALQDNHRAMVVGMPTSGAGSIQTVIPLNGGRNGALKITTSLVYRPSGKGILETGVVPDLVVAPSKEAAEALAKRQPNLPEIDVTGTADRPTLSFPEPPTAESPPDGYEGDYQLTRALALFK